MEESPPWLIQSFIICILFIWEYIILLQIAWTNKGNIAGASLLSKSSHNWPFVTHLMKQCLFRWFWGGSYWVHVEMGQDPPTHLTFPLPSFLVSSTPPWMKKTNHLQGFLLCSPLLICHVSIFVSADQQCCTVPSVALNLPENGRFKSVLSSAPCDS